jgi:hypothetical protein
MLEFPNVKLFDYADKKIDGKKVSVALQKEVTDNAFHGLPIKFKVGKVSYTLGFVSKVRAGRDNIFGDIILELNGDVEYELELDEKGELTGIRPTAFILDKEPSSFE